MPVRLLLGKFRSTKAAVKLHTVLDLKTSIPEFVLITEGNVHDVNAIEIEKGSYFVMDKGYIDFKRLYRIHKERAFSVVRAKDNLGAYSIAKKSVKREQSIVADDYIHLAGSTSSRSYPKCLRFIQYHDIETGKDLSFLTNNFKISALTVA